jgi:hypothetical protein
MVNDTDESKPRTINEYQWAFCLGIITWLRGSGFYCIELYMSSWSKSQNSCKNPCGYTWNSKNTVIILSHRIETEEDKKGYSNE